jgi:hypothetical protein
VNASLNRVSRSTSIQQRGQMDLRQARGYRLRERLSFVRHLFGGQRRHDQIAVLADAGQALTRWVREDSLQICHSRAQLGLQSVQLPRQVGVGSGDGAEVVALCPPGLDGDEQRGRVGVAAGVGHPHVAGAQLRLHAVQHTQFPVVAVGGSAALASGLLEVFAPAGRHERCRCFGGRLGRHCRATGPVQLAQYLGRVE